MRGALLKAKLKQLASKSATKRSRNELLAAVAFEALSGANVGTWEWDVAHDIVNCCSVTARLFGVSEISGVEGISLRRFKEGIHPDDLLHFNHLLEKSCQDGGLFIAEYRTVPQPNGIHWILARGTFDLDEIGMALCGRGIVIDITNAKRGEPVDDRGLYFSRSPPSTPPIDAIADRVLDGLAIAEGLEPDEFVRIKPLFDRLLLEIGRQIASDLAEGPPRSKPGKIELN